MGGLALHDMVVHQRGKRKFLNYAIQVYDKIYNMILEHDHIQTIPGIELLLMATCNNMGHISSLMCNYEGVAICQNSLQVLFARYQVRNTTTTTTTTGEGIHPTSSSSSSTIDPSDQAFFAMAVGNIAKQNQLSIAPAA